MFYRTYIDKDNTIYKNDKINVGQNPIGELYFSSEKGDCNIYSRHLIHFPLDHLIEKYLNCELGDLTNTKHILTLYPANPICGRKIASDVDVLIYKLCQNFEEGCGYDLNKSDCNTLNINKQVYSLAPSNWFESSYCNEWCEQGSISYTNMTVTIDESCLPIDCLPNFEKLYYEDLPLTNISGQTIILSGETQKIYYTDIDDESCELSVNNIYDTILLSSKTSSCELTPRTICYDIPLSGDTNNVFTGSTINTIVNSNLDNYAIYDLSATSEIVDMYHIGCSNYCGLQFDLTDCINDYITGNTTNYGFGISLHPKHELYDKGEYSIPFYNRNTLTFFKPHLDTICHNQIIDDRHNFEMDCEQKIYFESNRPLDENPIVTIIDNNNCFCLSAETKCVSNCLYEACITLTGETDCELYRDIWSNIKINGKEKKDVINIINIIDNNNIQNKYNNYGVSISGIRKNEIISKCEKRRVYINLTQPLILCDRDNVRVDQIMYRIFVKQGLSELDVICWTPINYTNCEYWFDLDSSWMLPTNYYLDIKVISNKQINKVDKAITFKVNGKANNCLNC